MTMQTRKAMKSRGPRQRLNDDGGLNKFGRDEVKRALKVGRLVASM